MLGPPCSRGPLGLLTFVVFHCPNANLVDPTKKFFLNFLIEDF